MESPYKASTILKKIPFDIVFFFLFAFAISVLSFYLNLDMNKKLKATLIPYTGWGFGNGYLFILFFIPFSLLSFKGTVAKTLRFLRIVIILIMLLQLYQGVRDWLQVTPENYANSNPYLRYDTLTPIYTIAVPSFWILVMAVALLWNLRKKKSISAGTQP